MLIACRVGHCAPSVNFVPMLVIRHNTALSLSDGACGQKVTYDGKAATDAFSCYKARNKITNCNHTPTT